MAIFQSITIFQTDVLAARITFLCSKLMKHVLNIKNFGKKAIKWGTYFVTQFFETETCQTIVPPMVPIGHWHFGSATDISNAL